MRGHARSIAGQGLWYGGTETPLQTQEERAFKLALAPNIAKIQEYIQARFGNKSEQ